MILQRLFGKEKQDFFIRKVMGLSISIGITDTWF